MLGAIIGDTVGSAYEFNNTKNYNLPLFTVGSGYTDDSLMSMAVATWLIQDPSHSHNTLEKIMVDFAAHCPCPKGGFGPAFLNWLFYPERLPLGTDGKRHPYGSWGNGSAMRVSAVGWFFDTLDETERVAGISADITHNHPEGIKGAKATAAAIWLARNGKSKKEIREYIESTYGYDLSTSWEEYHRTYGWDVSCQGTVPPAIGCFLESTDFEDAIRKAVSIGGDSDTLACITGGMAEAFYGVIPEYLSEPVLEMFPKAFNDVLDYMKAHTAYGKPFPIR